MAEDREELLRMAGVALAAFNVLFARPDPAGEPAPPEGAGGVWLRCYHRALTAIRRKSAPAFEVVFILLYFFRFDKRFHALFYFVLSFLLNLPIISFTEPT